MSEQQPPGSSKSPIIVDWERVRAQIQHEDALINHRITWLIQINAMLLAAFAAGVWFKDPGRANQLSPEQTTLSLLLIIILSFGLLVSVVTVRSVKLANDQIDHLYKWWTERVKGEKELHPKLIGVPKRSVDRVFRYSYVVPAAFAVLWLALAFASFYNYLIKLQMMRDWLYAIIIVVLLLMLLFKRQFKTEDTPKQL
jgi:hypothetical protein